MNNFEKKTIGVVVITYNGEKYIREQLYSILNQSILPDKVIIYDDNSTDNTFEIIENFIKKNNLSWELYKNKVNVGWCKNIYNALRICNTDLIFWSDQDDLWFENKIKDLKDVVLSNKNCVLAYSAWEYIDSYGNDLSMHLKKSFFKKNIYTLKYNKQPHRIPPLLGCSMCIKKELIDYIKPKLFNSCEFYSTDSLIYYCGRAIGDVLYINKPLFKRRIHENNLTTSKETLKRRWVFDYDKMNQTYKILRLQYKTLTFLIKYFKKENINTKKIKFLIYENRYLYYRLNYINGSNCILKYFFSAIHVCSFSDLIYIFWKDLYYKLIK